MFVKSVKLTNFRNYESLFIAFTSKNNILYGENAQGKTNILEAIFLCATGRSHRTSKDTELIRFSTENAAVELILEKPDFGEIKIAVEVFENGKKKIKVNDILMKRMGDIMGHLNCVIFSPEDLSIIKDEPQQRRRFLDMFISQIRPAYFFDLQKYLGTMRQRNALLKQIREERGRHIHNPSNLATLDAWDEQLAQTGSRIIGTRKYYVEKIAYSTERNHRSITAEKEVSETKYMPSVKVTEAEFSQGVDAIRSRFLKCLEDSRETDISRTGTSYGPHRDELCFFIDHKSVKLFGSQGQQRTVALALKMAQVDIMKEETGDMPILLLDDVMSELDRERQENLTQNMKETQIFMTGTEQYLFDGWAKEEAEELSPHYFRVESGTVQTR